MRWYRAYVGTVTDKKIGAVALRSGVSRSVVFAAWHVILESAADANAGGEAKCDEFDVSAALGEPLEAVQRILVCMAEADMFRDGKVTKWRERQYESDSSLERVRKYREKRKDLGLPSNSDYSRFHEKIRERDGEDRCVYCGSEENLQVDHMMPVFLGGTDHSDNLAFACKRCNSGKSGRTPEMARFKFICQTAEDAYRRYVTATGLPVTVSETPPDTEADTDSESKKARAREVAKKFSEFWSVYPKRTGSNRKSPAEKAFVSAVNAGADPDQIIVATRKFAAAEAANVGTPFIPMAVTWLHQKGWEEHIPTAADSEKWQAQIADMARRGFIWKDDKWQKVA